MTTYDVARAMGRVERPIKEQAAEIFAAAPADYSTFSKDELKDALRAKGLPVSGKKSELIERLEG